MNATRLIIVLLVSFLLFDSVSYAHAKEFAPSFRGVGDLPGGEYQSNLTGLSADGMTAVGTSSSFPVVEGYGGSQPYRWTQAGEMEGLGYLQNSPFGSAEDVSGDGSIVIGTCPQDVNKSANESFIWTQAEGMRSIGHLPDSMNTFAFAISDNGTTVVGQSSASNTTQAFRWSEATGIVGLGDLPGGSNWSFAQGASADGSVIVGSGTELSPTGFSVSRAFRWTQDDGMLSLGDLPGGGFGSAASAVSADGLTIVGDTESALGHEAFRWTQAEGMIGLEGLGSASAYVFTEANAVSADGSIIVGTSYSNSTGYDAFIWDAEHGMRSLTDLLTNDLGIDLQGWTLIAAVDISADGLTIGGVGDNPSGQREGWIATIPEPASIALMLMSTTLLRIRRVRNK